MSWSMIWPVLVVVGANTLYNITAKSTPETINPFASLCATYAVAMVCAAAAFLATSHEKNLFAVLRSANWATFALGLAVVGLEIGFISLYRSGWKISTGQLVCSIALTCVLLVVGLVAYRETLTLKQVIGMVVCAAGLILIA